MGDFVLSFTSDRQDQLQTSVSDIVLVSIFDLLERSIIDVCVRQCSI